MKKSKLKVIIGVIVIFGILLFINIYIFTKNFKKEEKIEVKAPSQSEICLEEGGIWNYNDKECEYYCEENFSIKFQKEGYIEFDISNNDKGISKPCRYALSQMKNQIEKTISNELINKNTRTTVKENFSCKEPNYQLYKYKNKSYSFKPNPDTDTTFDRNLIFELSENDNKILELEMFSYVTSAISEFGFIDEKLFFTFNKVESNEEKTKVSEKTYFDGKILNEDYKEIENIKNLFVYKDKIGFLGKKGGEEYLFYDGKEVSKAFARTLTYPYADIPTLFEIDLENGIVGFLAKRGEKSFVVYKNLDFEF